MSQQIANVSSCSIWRDPNDQLISWRTISSRIIFDFHTIGRNIPVKDPLNPLKYDYPIDFCKGRTCQNDETGGQYAAVSSREDLHI